MKKTVRDILNSKGFDLYCIAPTATVFDALAEMAEKNIGALVVKDEKNVVGIISERDYARKVILQGKSSKGLPVSEIMSIKVACVSLDRTAEEAMALMTDKYIRHLPVVDESNKPIGLISIGDAVKALIEDRDFVIEQLEKYIRGSW